MPEDRIPAAADATERLERTLDRHRLLGHSNQRGKGAAGEFLAIPAMAHRRARRLGLGCVAHRAAEAATFDLHLKRRAILPSRLKAEGVLPIHRPRPDDHDQLCGQLGTVPPRARAGFCQPGTGGGDVPFLCRHRGFFMQALNLQSPLRLKSRTRRLSDVPFWPSYRALSNHAFIAAAQ